MANREDIERARQGKDVWNAWAHMNSGAMVDFSNATLKAISFAEFQFPGLANFTGVTFSKRADFTGAKFSDEACFMGAKFSDQADFAKASFFKWARFIGVKISGRADFTGARFFERAHFDGAKFSEWAIFTGVKFSGWADFAAAKFSGWAGFTDSIFSEWADFTGATFVEVDFSNIKLEGLTDFREITFNRAPIFHGASIHQGTIFGNIDEIFTDFQSDGAEQSYRTLKLAMGQHQARTEEAAFAALELKSRRYRLMQEAKERPFWKRIPFWAEPLGYLFWEKCSKSGRSFSRPFGLYLTSWLVFAALYVLPCQGWRGDWWTGLRYSFFKQFPFAAAFRGGPNRIAKLEEALFSLNNTALPPGWVDALNSVQALTALILIFLMGLGIRHKFRLR